MRTLEDYKDVVGVNAIGTIHKKARKLLGKRVVHVNSTNQGGGVAEILSSLVPLMNDVGLSAGWRVLHGNPDFFNITKKFHNGLQGDPVHFTRNKERIYIQTNIDFAAYTHLSHDCIIIHDPQPLPMIKFYKKAQPWVWRCHVDFSNPDKTLWDFLSDFILRYDLMLLSHESYKKDDIPVEQRIIVPAIDPITPKNMDITEDETCKYLRKFGVKTDKPYIVQVSRFDKWKDPEGVIKVWARVKEEVDCRLVLCGNIATDDPEGGKLFQAVQKSVKQYSTNDDVILLLLENNYLVNALQRKAAVVIQKSIKEGFCLAVTEAMWKGTPVVASKVGGIPLQIKDGVNGFLLEPDDIEGFADRIIKILKDKEMGKEMGKQGKEITREKFLITRLLSDYLDLLEHVWR
tara:strand:- start:17166 stop:18374 length:1209 start_codon:yes stop_codon:yes gene_type:complete